MRDAQRRSAATKIARIGLENEMTDEEFVEAFKETSQTQHYVSIEAKPKDGECDWCNGSGEIPDCVRSGVIFWCGKCKGTGRPVEYKCYANGDEVGGRVNANRFTGPTEVWFLGHDRIRRGAICGSGQAAEWGYEEGWRIQEGKNHWLGGSVPSEAITTAEDWRADIEFCEAVHRMCCEVITWCERRDEGKRNDKKPEADLTYTAAQKIASEIDQMLGKLEDKNFWADELVLE